MNKGIVAINKPQGWTSFDVVNKIKYMVKPVKVGHLGTLDPMATGVLLVTVGSATKLFDLMQTKSKTYVAKFKFGIETDTLDATGAVVKTVEQIPSVEQIKTVLPMFIGKISQIPPKYSAKKVNGSKAYDLARAGIDFELKPKEIDISRFELLEHKGKQFSFVIECSSGTYIRAIGRDLADLIGTPVCMIKLVRVEATLLIL
jgi:tRNA pseudouridine55 synthase